MVERLTSTLRDASDVINSATGQEIAQARGQALKTSIAEPALTPDIPTARTSQARESNLNLVQSSEVFEEEVADIEQVHCESQLFEFELSGHLPRVNVKGNL